MTGVPLIIGLVLPALFWDQGCVEREATTFIRQYTADRPLLATVFDPHLNDLGTYQARELSYFFDLIDARAYAPLTALLGAGFTIPLSALVSSLVMVLTFLVGARRTMPQVDRLTTAALLLCLVTSFGFVSTMGLFYRSAKPMLAAVLVVWLFVVRGVQQRRDRSGGHATPPITLSAALVFTLTLVAGLLDRQGFFCAVAAAALLALHYRWTAQLRDVLVASVTAVIVLQVYNLLVAPLTIHAVNGYWPDFSYQMIPTRELLRLPSHVLRAVALLFQNTALLFGGSLIVGALLALWGLIVASQSVAWPAGARTWSGMLVWLRRDAPGRLLVYGLLVLAAQVLLFALMIARHGYVYRWIDHRYWYYPIPYLVVAVFGALLVLNAQLPRLGDRDRRWLPVALLVLAAGNVVGLGYHREVMKSGPWFGPVHAQCLLLKTSLRNNRADPGLDPEYRALFAYRASLP